MLVAVTHLLVVCCRCLKVTKKMELRVREPGTWRTRTEQMSPAVKWAGATVAESKPA